jgi:nucleotide-binding universal stress UspA family protein
MFRPTEPREALEMDTIVVAAKAGTDEPWVADAAAELAGQTGARAHVVSVDGVDVETLSPTPRSEMSEIARKSADAIAARLKEKGVDATADVRPGRVVRGILVYAEEVEADMIVVGASRLGPVARRLLGDVPLELVQRSRRPVLVVSPPSEKE